MAKKPTATKKTRNVVIRSSASGVWQGELQSQNNATRSVILHNARRAWEWTGAASCSGLATGGPGGGKIAAPVSAVEIFDVCEILDASPSAVEQWKAVPAWTV